MIKQMTGLKSFSALVGGLLALGFSVAPAVADKMEQKASLPETQIVAGHHETKTKNIVETAVDADDFELLVAAVKAAGLVDVLSSGEDKFTVFAPTDKAFAALGEEKLKDLLKPETKEKLAAILKYHVVSGVVKSTDLQEGKVKVETVQGSKVKIKLDGS